MGIFDPASSKGEDLQENAATSVERGLEADSQAVAGREPLGSESTPIVKPASASESVPRRETIDEIMDRRRKEKGLPPIRRIPDRSSEVKEGHVMLHSGFSRYVVLRPDNVVVKLGSYLNLDEVDAINFAKDAGIPVPEVLGWGEQASAGRKQYIEMKYIEGTTLERVWRDLSDETRLDIAHQLRDILRKMRALPPPENYVGNFNSDRIIDARGTDTFIRPACRNEEEFNMLLTAESGIPEPIKRAYRTGMVKHKIVFSHCDIAPRNIMVRDNRIVALIDWEGAGWYPEYWDYVKLMHFADKCPGWKELVDEIFPESYNTELLYYAGLRCYQEEWDTNPYQSKKGRNQELPKRDLPQESRATD